MGADAFLGFYGVKIALHPDDEETFEACGVGTDPRCVRARGTGLETWSGRMTEGEDYYLYVGRRVASIGLEAASHTAVSRQSLQALFDDVDRRLATAGLSSTLPALHFQLEAQY